MDQGNVNVALNELRQMDVAHLGGVDPAKAWHLLADHSFFDGFDRCQDIESFRFRALRNAIVVLVESGRRGGRRRNGRAVINAAASRGGTECVGSVEIGRGRFCKKKKKK